MDEPALPISLGFLLSDSARLMRRHFDQRARGLGLTRAQWQVLAYLARHEGINQVGLADLLDLEPITLCRLVDRMEEGGWVTRRPDPGDRRARLLFMTEKAKPVIVQMRGLAEEIYAEAQAGMSEADKSQLICLLAHVRANLAEPSARAIAS
jgi:DNA-binding MarR family transcriptional regulator